MKDSTSLNTQIEQIIDIFLYWVDHQMDQSWFVNAIREYDSVAKQVAFFTIDDMYRQFK